MDINIFYFLQVLTLSGILSVCYYFFFRQGGNHKAKRIIILSFFALSIILPFIKIPIEVEEHFVFPVSFQRNLVLNDSPGETLTLGNTQQIQTNIGFAHAAELLFILISLVFLFRLLHSLWLIIKKIRTHRPVTHDKARLIYDETIDQPFSYFNWIFLPSSLKTNHEMLAAVLEHETTHIKRWHSADKMIIELLKIIFWWNPFFYYLERNLKLVHEYEADASASQKIGVQQYAAILLHHLLPADSPFLSNPFYSSPIKSRIMMMLQPSKKSIKYWILIPVMALSVLIFSTSFQKLPDTLHTTASLNVVVDAGHGGMDIGATQANLQEKDLTLALAQALQQISKGTNINIILTREGDELPVPGNINESLIKRVMMTNDADAMVSIHVGTNAPKTKTASGGIMAFVAGKNDAYAGQSLPLANALLNGFVDGPLPVEPNIQQRRQQGIYVLDNSPRPSVLLEVGFMDNGRDIAVLSSPEGIRRLAGCILKGLKEYAHKAPSPRS